MNEMGWRWYVIYLDGLDDLVRICGKLRKWEISAQQELEARFASWPDVPGMPTGAAAIEWGVELVRGS